MTLLDRRPILACVIVDHDHSEAAAAQLRLLTRASASISEPVEIVLVQNGRRRLSQHDFPAARIIDSPNRGYGAAVNLGAKATTAPVVLALNADLVLTEAFLEEASALAKTMLETDAVHRIGVVGGALFDSAGRRQPSFGPWPTLLLWLLGLLRPRRVRRYWPTANRFRDVPWATGACFMFRRDCWQELGGFDECFFMYYEDVDFCRRAWQRRWRVTVSPTPRATHFQPYHQRPVTVEMAKMARRSMLVYCWKHRPRREFRILSTIILLECWWRRRTPNWSEIDRLVRDVIRHPRALPFEET
jgi:N-acetylglucosaminyl-diphospho-decaprenol L-rhamnosyltransferase